MNNITFDYILNAFASEGYLLLSKTYNGNRKKLDYICPQGHHHSISWDNWRGKKRCPYCAGRPPIDSKFVNNYLNSFGYMLLSEYKNNNTKFKVRCNKGHDYFTTWMSIYNNKHRCPHCSNNARMSFADVKKAFNSENYILLDSCYKNAHTKLRYICPNGHRGSITWSNWNNAKKFRCPKCSNRISKQEIEIQQYIKSLNVIATFNDRSLLVNPYTGRSLELDVFIKDQNKAIEFNGEYWHSDAQRINIDSIKKELCRLNNIELLIVQYNDWKNDKYTTLDIIRKFVGGGLI